MKEFVKSVKFKILICIFALLFGFMFYAATSNGSANFPEAALKTVTQPFVSAATAMSGWMRNTIDTLVNADKYKRENEVLRRQLTEMYSQIMDKEETDKENELLKKMFGIIEERKDFEISPPCNIIAREAMDVFGGFTINKGSNSGIKLNDPVFTEIGLVGIVSETAPTYSKVTTILSTETHIGVKTASGGVVGIIENDILYSSNRQCRASYIEKDSDIKIGDVIVTAGGSMYPSGLIIGSVADIYPDDNGLSLHAVIEPAADIYKITDVFVITSFEGQGVTP